MFKKQLAAVLALVLTLNMMTACTGNGPRTESATGNSEDAALVAGAARRRKRSDGRRGKHAAAGDRKQPGTRPGKHAAARYGQQPESWRGKHTAAGDRQQSGVWRGKHEATRSRQQPAH